MDIYIDKIDTYEIRNRVNKIKWRPIYEVIEEAYFTESEIFSDDFILQCTDNPNEDKFIPLKIKNNRKRMIMEQGLYAQVIMLRRNDLIFTDTNKNKNRAKFKFQGQFVRPQR